MAKNKHRHIVRNKIPVSSQSIPAASIPPDGYLRFSFKHLDLITNKKFSVGLCEKGYLEKFLHRLREICGVSVADFMEGKSAALRGHPIDWEKTTERKGFTCLNEQLRSVQAWQFQITSNKHGRIHGILLGNVFYVVWIDPCHSLYV